MKLWLISLDVNGDYDMYDSAVVAAETAEEAQRVKVGFAGTWAESEHVKVELIGVADPSVNAGVVLASFNAG